MVKRLLMVEVVMPSPTSNYSPAGTYFSPDGQKVSAMQNARPPKQLNGVLLLLITLAAHCHALLSSPSSPDIICCSSSTELQRAVSLFLQPSDSVLEFGAQLSDVSSLICSTIGSKGSAVLVDIERSASKSGRCNYRNSPDFFQGIVDFVALPLFENWRETLFVAPNSNKHYDVLVVDLGHMVGNDLYMTTLSMTDEILEQIKISSNKFPRLVLVKSKTVSSLARRLIQPQRLEAFLQERVQNLRDDRVATSKDTPLIVPSVRVTEYRQTIPFVVRPGDVVLEVGCHFGRTTKLLHEAVQKDSSDESTTPGLAIGVDIGPKIIKSAQQQYPDIPFHVGDAWKSLDLLKLRPDDKKLEGYDVIYADIGGLSGAHGALESLALLDSFANALQPRYIVIKSLCTRRLSSRLKPFVSIWARHIKKNGQTAKGY